MSSGDIMQNNLRKLRKENNLTQVALQMQTGIEQALLSKFENGERIPPTESLMILADFYNVSILRNNITRKVRSIVRQNKEVILR